MMQASLLGLTLVLTLARVTLGKECYVCSGAFPERDCEMWPDRVRHGPGKQECGSRHCTTYVRYRPMQHLLIPLGPNKPKATAAPLRPADFEAVSISRDCVDRIPQERDNKCIPDADGLGATCFTSCNTALCNGDLRKPNNAELSRGDSGASQGPTYTGPNQFDNWSQPPTTRLTMPATKPTTTRRMEFEMDKNMGDSKGGKDMSEFEPEVKENKPGRRHRIRNGHSKRGESSNIRGMPEEAADSGAVNVQCACVGVITAFAVLFSNFL